MKIDSWQSAADAMRAVVILLDGILPSRDSTNVWELIDAGEPDLAFDTLCTQIYEFDIQLDQSIWMEIAQIGSYLNLNSDLWMVLKPTNGDT
jgi:hypothetical protein